MARIQTPPHRLLAAALLTAIAAGPLSARAEDALKTLGGMHKTAPIDWPADAADRRQGRRRSTPNLESVKLPPGFHIDLYALVPDARHMAVGPQGVVTFVGTRKTQGLGGDRPRAQRRRRRGEGVRARSIPKNLPNGPCCRKDGFLYIVGAEPRAAVRRRPSSSTRARTSPWAWSCPRAS